MIWWCVNWGDEGVHLKGGRGGRVVVCYVVS